MRRSADLLVVVEVGLVPAEVVPLFERVLLLLDEAAALRRVVVAVIVHHLGQPGAQLGGVLQRAVVEEVGRFLGSPFPVIARRPLVISPCSHTIARERNCRYSLLYTTTTRSESSHFFPHTTFHVSALAMWPPVKTPPAFSTSRCRSRSSL